MLPIMGCLEEWIQSLPSCVIWKTKTATLWSVVGVVVFGVVAAAVVVVVVAAAVVKFFIVFFKFLKPRKHFYYVPPSMFGMMMTQFQNYFWQMDKAYFIRWLFFNLRQQSWCNNWVEFEFEIVIVFIITHLRALLK